MPPARSRPTVRQIARICGVSAMTVSAVLNNRQGQMSAETREKVLKVVRELGYRPTPSKWEISERETLTLGVIVGKAGESLTTPSYSGDVIKGVIMAADNLSHNITLFTNTLHDIDPHRSIRIYCDDRCDGLLVVAPNIGSELIKALYERGFPFISLGDAGDDERISCIDIDNIEAGYTITSYLLAQGHRRIAFIGGEEMYVRCTIQRKEGYLQALKDHQIEVNPDLILNDMSNIDVLREPLIALLQRPVEERPTAIFAWHDQSALEIMTIADELSLHIPDDISLVGINDIDYDPRIPNFLTTYRQPYLEISKRAVEMLIAQIRGTASLPQREFLRGTLIVRKSVAPPR